LGKVIDSFDALTFGDGTGPGGNQKIGQYEYGADYPGFGVTINGSTYTMNTTNAKTVDLNHGASGSHTLKWTYVKDASVVSGSDCGWVDKLELQ
jgi:hypothetical protein